MSMNKFMHPRNPYKKRPDFKQLAIEFPEFRKYAQQDIAGKISFNFKDQGAVWALTKCLLQRDFDLKVEIVPGHLVPTLPLRLNYLLWIEDLLELYKPMKVLGIDIGTGSNAIYPLLAAKQLNWNMLCTEVDIASTKCAISNVENNYLLDKITVKSVTEDVILEGVLDEETFYDFCMCNPPFFSDSTELSMESKSRSQSRKPPNNAPTGVPNELITPGGESVFVARIIEDSCILQERVRIYTVMVGKKSTLKPLKEILRNKNVCCMSTTMFCQGKITRWGLAWTFIPGLDLTKVDNSKKKSKVSYIPFVHNIQKSDENTFESIKSKIINLLGELQIEIDLEESESSLIMITIKAFENTWMNSRKKRRLERKKANSASEMTNDSTVSSNQKENIIIENLDNLPCDSSVSLEKPQLTNENSTSEETVDSTVTHDKKENVIDNNIDTSLSDSSGFHEKKIKPSNENSTDDEAIDSTVSSNNKGNGVIDNKETSLCDSSGILDENTTQSVDDIESSQNSVAIKNECEIAGSSTQKSTVDKSNNAKRKVFEEYLVASLILKDTLNYVCVELYFLDGTGGKDAANQLLFYIKNRIY